MIYDKVIEGRFVDLKSATVEDAEFALSIRQDPEFTKYLPKLDISISEQIAWIERQQEKEDDYFFIVYDKKGNRLGTYGIYDINNSRAETGRLAMRGNALQNLEMQLLVYQFAYNVLNLQELYGFTYDINVRNQRFIQQFGAYLSEPYVNEKGVMVKDVLVKKEDFERCESNLKRFLYRN